MSDGMKLSQAEIDALLNGVTSTPAPSPDDEFVLNDQQRDALGEIGNISFGSAATSLSTLLQQRVDITTPSVSLIHSDTVQNSLPKPYVMVAVEFTLGLKGSNALAIELDDAKTIADLMMGGDGTNIAGELNELHLSAVGEAMNQMMGGAATSMSQIFGRRIDISPPIVKVLDLASSEVVELGLQGWIANVQFNLKVGSLIDSTIMQLLPASFALEMLEALGLNGEAEPAEVAVIADERMAINTTQATPATQSGDVASQDLGTKIAAEPEVQHMAQSPINVGSSQQLAQPIGTRTPNHAATQISFQQPELSDFAQDMQMSGPPPRNLSLLLDVPLNVTVELGRAKRMIREILDLAPGAILELDKLAGEPVDIMVNQKRIAIGEVVVIDENFGVRVTDIVSPSDRVKNLQ